MKIVLTFEMTNKAFKKIADGTSINGKLNLKTLIPIPGHIYTHGLTIDETINEVFGDNHFACWALHNWGCCSVPSMSKYHYQDIEHNCCAITFQSAAAPYPFLTAIGNCFKCSFTLYGAKKKKHFIMEYWNYVDGGIKRSECENVYNRISTHVRHNIYDQCFRIWSTDYTESSLPKCCDSPSYKTREADIYCLRCHNCGHAVEVSEKSYLNFKLKGKK